MDIIVMCCIIVEVVHIYVHVLITNKLITSKLINSKKSRGYYYWQVPGRLYPIELQYMPVSTAPALQPTVRIIIIL